MSSTDAAEHATSLVAGKKRHDARLKSEVKARGRKGAQRHRCSACCRLRLQGTFAFVASIRDWCTSELRSMARVFRPWRACEMGLPFVGVVFDILMNFKVPLPDEGFLEGLDGGRSASRKL